MTVQDYAEPIEYLVDNYFKKKRIQATYSNSTGLNINLTSMYNEGDPKDDLPDIPCKILRDSNGRAHKFIYGDTEALTMNDEASPIIWQQELIRRSDGKLEKMIVTYPDGETVTELLIRGPMDKVTDYAIEKE